MKFLNATLLAFLAAGVSFAEPPSNFSGWELVFEDNFDGTSLDKTKWNPTYNWGPTHNHRAYCAEENVIVSDGTLKLKGEKKKHPKATGDRSKAKFNNKEIPVDYTSGAIDTKNHFEVKYGYIEGRFKAPWQKGTWPAFWTLQDGWPPEIDILEIPASRKQHHYYLHYTDPSWYSSHGSAWDHEASFGGHKDDNTDRSAGFHNYAVEWDESTLSFYFDDKKFASYNRPTEIKQLSAQYIIVNLAIGGWAGDDIEITADKPAYFEADWVRVWQAKPAKPDTVRIMSMNFGTCMVRTAEDKLALGDCKGDNAIATITPLSGSAYRINFGDLSLDTPDESKEAGHTMSLYKWNGGAHQKVSMQKQSGYEGSVVRMKMQHSDMYLRATTDAERVVQSWEDDWRWYQMWRLLKPDEEIPEKDTVQKDPVPADTTVKDTTKKDSTKTEPAKKDSTEKDPVKNDSTKKDTSAADSGKSAIPVLSSIANVYGTTAHYVSGHLFVEIGSAFKNGASVRILDLQGREVMRQFVAHGATMDVRSLAPGMYHVAVSDGKHVDVKRFKK